MKKYLVIGADGFIGANVVRALIQRGYSTAGVVENGCDTWRLEPYFFKNNVHSCDFSDESSIRRIIRSEKPEKIFFCQDYGSQPYHNREEKLFFLNVQNLRFWLKESIEFGFDSFITIGSHQEYDLYQNAALAEEHLLRPIADYGVAKASATHFVLKEAHRTKLPIYVVRPFNLFGDYFASNSIMSGMINMILGKKYFYSNQIPLSGDFLYIEDFVNALISISFLRPKNSNIFNVGSGSPTAVSDFYKMLSSELKNDFGKDFVKNSLSLESHLLNNRIEGYSDISKVSSLGWIPDNNTAQGVRKMCSWWKSFYKIGKQDLCLKL